MDRSDILQEYRIAGTPAVFEVGTVRALPIHPDRVLDFWVFAVMTHGRMPIQIGSERTVVQTGEYFLLPPGIRHYGTERTPFDTIWIHFTCPAKREMGSDPTDLLLPVCGPMPPEINYGAWGNFLKRSVMAGSLPVACLGTQLLAMLDQATAERHRQQALARPGTSLARRTLELLLRSYGEPITTERLCAELGYSYGHIEREFRQHYAVTIRQKLVQIRIEEATALIRMGKTLREAAHETGFTDYYYFIRVFTRLKGISPGRLTPRS